MMAPTAMASSNIAFDALLNVTRNTSSCSSRASSITITDTIISVSPAAKLIVPSPAA